MKKNYHHTLNVGGNQNENHNEQKNCNIERDKFRRQKENSNGWLKSFVKKLGYDDVKTYIQSGNQIFNSNVKNSELENALEKAIAEKYGFSVPVIVRSSKELQTTIDKNPFFDKDIGVNNLHLTFLKEKPKQENLEKT